MQYESVQYDSRAPISAFVFQYYGLVLDILVLCQKRAGEMTGPPQILNNFLQFRDSAAETRHPVRLYSRMWTGPISSSASPQMKRLTLFQRHLSADPDPTNNNDIRYNDKRCWPRDCDMRLIKHDVNPGLALIWNMKQCVLWSLFSLTTIAQAFLRISDEGAVKPLHARSSFCGDYVYTSSSSTVVSVKFHELWLYNLQNRELVEHSAHRLNDLLSRSGHPHR